MSARSLALSALLAALPLSLAADAARAQQRPAPRFARAATPAAMALRDGALADSVARYQHVARVQRWTGSTLVVAGLGAVAAAYVQFARAGRQGMSGAQGATFAAGTIAGVAGLTRWASSRDNMRLAEQWNEARLAAQR